jgi:hypothetical protein
MRVVPRVETGARFPFLLTRRRALSLNPSTRGNNPAHPAASRIY